MIDFLRTLGLSLMVGATLLLALIGLLSVITPYDATDPPGGRSGMGLHTDHETGCQYLSRSGITPRLDAAGQHMGCRR